MEVKSSCSDKKSDHDVCDRRDMKLKEAEKTIANKDVIIKMLQDQVKKLEDSYKQNMKETENFRYRFYLASEQVTRLRGLCPKVMFQMKELPQKTKILDRDISAEITKWKNQCDQLIDTDCSGTCKYVQQIRNVAKIMKAHYELLQLLSEKFTEKATVETDLNVLERLKNEYNDQISKLQDEITRLKDDNLKLQKQIVEQQPQPPPTSSEDKVEPELEDSNLKNQSASTLLTAKDSLLETYKRNNQELQRQVSKIIETIDSPTMNDHDDEEEMSIPSYDTPLRRVSFSKDKLSDSSRRSILKEKGENVDEGRSGRLSKVRLEPAEEDSISESVDKACDCQCKDVQVQATETAIKREITTQRTTQTEEAQDEDETSDVNNTKEVAGENEEVTKICNESHDQTQKSPQANLDSEEKKDDEVDGKSCICNEDSAENRTEPLHFENPVRPLSDEHLDPDRQKVEERALSMTNRFPIDDMNSDIDSSDAEEQSNEETKGSSPEKESDTKTSTFDMNEMILKLNDIGDRVSQLLEKQDDTCKELESLKTELTEARDSAQACTDNIVKLAQTIDDQKETFLDKFEEHKAVTDNLVHANEEIQQELGDLKEKIEGLLNKENPTDAKTEVCPDGDDVVTSEECKPPIPVPVEDTTTEESVGIPEDKTDASSDETNPELKKPDGRHECSEEACKTNDQCENGSKNATQKTTDEVEQEIQKDEEPTSVTNEDRKLLCKCDDDDIHKYIEKLKEENVKVRTTISSVIDNLEGKLSDLKSAESVNPSSAIAKKLTSHASCNLDLCSCASVGSVCDHVTAHSDLEIEDIYNAVRRSVLPCQRFTKSSTSCLCANLNICSSCDCYREARSEDELYSCILCTCASKNVIQQSESCIKHSQAIKSSGVVRTATIESVLKGCPVEECPRSTDEFCNKESLISNLQTYVRYLHEQLDIITSIEDRIEDMRVNIASP